MFGLYINYASSYYCEIAIQHRVIQHNVLQTNIIRSSNVFSIIKRILIHFLCRASSHASSMHHYVQRISYKRCKNNVVRSPGVLVPLLAVKDFIQISHTDTRFRVNCFKQFSSHSVVVNFILLGSLMGRL